MVKTIPKFSTEQWDFLAVLDAFETSIAIAIIGQLAPLLPGPLFEVINKSKKLGWLIQSEDDNFAISRQIPAKAKKILAKINTPDRIATIVHQLQDSSPEMQVGPQTFILLMNKAGLEKEIIEMEIELANNFLKNNNLLQAWEILQQASDRMIYLLEDNNYKKLYIAAILELSNISFILGKGLSQLSKHLHKTHEVAKKLGDLRSHAIINMHLGRLYYFTDRREDALMALSIGIKGAEEFSDEDMLDRSAVFLGLFYFIQGLFKKALPPLERAVKLYESQEKGQPAFPLAIIFFGYTLLYLGEFHRAIGSLDCHWRMSKERSNHTIATTLRMLLGTALYLLKREKEADFHLKEAEKEAQASNNKLSLFFAKGVQSLKSFNSNRPVEAHEFLSRAMKTGIEAGFIRQFSSPWIMEMVYEFEKLGYEPIPDFITFAQIRERAVKENNVHLQGVALRLEAQKKIAENRSKISILNDLKDSEDCLDLSGDRIQLSKTILERARYELARDDIFEARRHIQKAWTTLREYADDYFPEDLKYLLTPEQQEQHSSAPPKESFDRYIELSESIFNINSQNEISSLAILAINRFLRAERGGLFQFQSGNSNSNPNLIASSNLTTNDIEADDFKQSREIIKRAFKKNQAILIRDKKDGLLQSGSTIKAMLCLPIELKNRLQAVLYHDNSYLQDSFDLVNTEMLNKMICHFSRQTTQLWKFFHQQKELQNLTVKKELIKESETGKVLIHKSQAMKSLAKQLSKVAPSDSTILLSGETGVGKEVIAHQIHALSQRHNEPFIIVDATTIPEGLIESELFGHEKGAFTGADRQKIGRLELAHKSSLFIDEIGELPKSIQVKLLRAIQEGTFFRLGGMRTIHSDFRLIAATNRNLAEEVTAGRFREDLYYRLNVIPLRVPPLRERREDIPLFTKYFLNLYAKRYQRSNLTIDSENEKLLQQYNWPGNVRELENIIERATLLSSEDHLEIDLPLNTMKADNHPFAELPTSDDLQRKYIQYVLDRTNGKVSGTDGATAILGLKRSTLVSRMRKLGLKTG